MIARNVTGTLTRVPLGYFTSACAGGDSDSTFDLSDTTSCSVAAQRATSWVHFSPVRIDPVVGPRDGGHHSHMTKHGMKGTPTYMSWQSMKDRCLNQNAPNFAHYGGRGIGVYGPWLDFGNFLRDMGPRPPGTSIDRINGDWGYSPDNCRWATREQQNANRRIACGKKHYSRLHPERLARGEKNGSAKLTAGQVLDIRMLGATGVPKRAIARMFTVSQRTIQFILSGEKWRHLLPENYRVPCAD